MTSLPGLTPALQGHCKRVWNYIHELHYCVIHNFFTEQMIGQSMVSSQEDDREPGGQSMHENG